MAQLPDTVAMTQDLEQYMQQTQESMLMTTTEQGVVAEKSEEEEEGSPSVQQTETVPAAEAESAHGMAFYNSMFILHILQNNCLRLTGCLCQVSLISNFYAKNFKRFRSFV